MAARQLLFLVSAGVLLSSTEVHGGYSKLPENYRKGVDLALEQLNSHSAVLHHFRFYKSIQKSDIEPGFDVSYIYHNFYLKATYCRKGIVDSSQCKFRNDRPLIDCSVCYKTFAGAIEKEPKPYIHCLHKPALTEVMKTERIDHCNKMGYTSGTPTLLASKGSK
ncbi:hypothetical protein DPEC_G00072130 [Dallia pectoralis]|uniref:Uncharacterized protein n=1 Tax=Dallia pectoralis TaxID=75939 RepID=A0ACC2H3M7_DALPE|nr:hypothetical protein DPEC_G00072130 [Dallia pectoralis]